MNGPFLLRSVSAPVVRLRLAAVVSVLGRSPCCDLVVPHPSVSRKHAELRVGPSAVTVTDLGSRNGTYLGERRVPTTRVRPGQVLRFGDVAFELIQGAEGADSDPEEETDLGRGDVSPAPPGSVATVVAEGLSRAQRRVFDQLRAGYSEKEIASRLRLSPHTVHNHVRAIYQAFQVHSRSEMLAMLLSGR
jgi:pSer/pThr/pTyr-binding forkhead associated (FHA) protein